MFADMSFKYPHHIGFLLLAFVGMAFFLLACRKKEKIMKAFRLSYHVRYKALRTLLLGGGMAFMSVALMGPQTFTGYAEATQEGMDIYVLIDSSKSMLVSDIAPDRITIAKKIIKTLLTHLEGDRIGFIPFASDAYVQMPLTDDYALADMFLSVVDTDMIGGGGTNLSAAIKLAYDSFDRSAGADRVIIIISDGEEQDQASLAALNGINDDRLKVYAVGVGTEKGGLVPVYNDTGDTLIDYMRNTDGTPVTSRLNASTLKQLAANGRGAYFQATLQGTETADLLSALSGLQRDTLSRTQVKRFNPLFQYFLGAGIVLFMLAWFLPESRRV